MEKKRFCPHCKTELEEENMLCPTCHYSIHWMKSGDSLYVNYIQSPLPKAIVLIAFILAIIGQLAIYVLDSSVNEYFTNRLPLPSIQTLHIVGHLLKTTGETILLYCLLHGLKYEYRSLGINIKITMILLLLYHLLAAALPIIQSHVSSPEAVKPIFTVCIVLLGLSEFSYFILGSRLHSNYMGGISTCGLLMCICSAVHFATSIIFNLSSKEFYTDSLLLILTFVYFLVLKNRILNHEKYMEKMIEMMNQP